MYELVMVSVKNAHHEIAKYLIDNWCGNDVFDRIAEMRECGGGILHCIKDIIFEKREFFDLNCFVDGTKGFIRYVHEKSRKENERVDSNGRNLLLIIPLIQTIMNYRIDLKHIYLLYKFLIDELNVDVNVMSVDGESMLSLEKNLSSNTLNDMENAEYYHKILSLVKNKKFVCINVRSGVSNLTALEEAVHLLGSKLRIDKIISGFGCKF